MMIHTEKSLEILTTFYPPKQIVSNLLSKLGHFYENVVFLCSFSSKSELEEAFQDKAAFSHKIISFLFAEEKLFSTL
jgi:hypothetical protein